MVKVRYKPVSPQLRAMATPHFESESRKSIGNEQQVGEYYKLSIDNLIPFKNQARKRFDEKELRDLSDTIQAHGILTPLIVVKSLEDVGKFEVIAGERRLRAARMIGLEKLPCIILREEVNAEKAAIIDNIQRSTMHPIELGEAYKKLLKGEVHGAKTDLAKSLGISLSSLSNHLSFSELPESVKEHLILHNMINIDQLRKFCSFETEEDIWSHITKENKLKKTKSLIRIVIENGEIQAQKRQIYKLDMETKQRLKEILMGILGEL
jgi:ParB family transcriptional regulator, chromosome partitioning protein